MLLALHSDTQTVHHRCGHCGTERHIALADLVVTPTTITTPVCHCDADHHSTESLRRNIPDWELGDAPHPGSLVGTVFPDTGGVVVAHTHGYSLDGATVAHKRLIRDLEAALIAQP